MVRLKQAVNVRSEARASKPRLSLKPPDRAAYSTCDAPRRTINEEALLSNNGMITAPSDLQLGTAARETVGGELEGLNANATSGLASAGLTAAIYGGCSGGVVQRRDAIARPVGVQDI